MGRNSKREPGGPHGRWIAVFVLLLLAPGCDLVVSQDCMAVALAGVVVNVLDASSGSPITQGLSGTLEDGDYQEEMFANPQEAQLVGAWERPGIYRVTATADGYGTAVIEGVRVEDGSCHVRTQERTVDLEPAESGS